MQNSETKASTTSTSSTGLSEAPKPTAVEDLERKLAMLGDDTTTSGSNTQNDPPPHMEVAEQAFSMSSPAASAAAPATGKNALLVRFWFSVIVVYFESKRNISL